MAQKDSKWGPFFDKVERGWCLEYAESERLLDVKHEIVGTKRIKLGRFAIRLDTVEKDGKLYPYSYVEEKDSVAVLARLGDKFVFIKQYRHSVKKWLYEIPGGAIEKSEDKETAARRELEEETGIVAGEMVSLGSFYPAAGSSNGECFLYYTECISRGEQHLEPLEYATVELLDQEIIESLISNGEILHSMAMVALLKYKVGNVNADREDKA